MKLIRAFVGHSFTEDDSEVVTKFLKYFEGLSQLHPQFSWTHAENAEPKILTEKVMNERERLHYEKFFAGSDGGGFLCAECDQRKGSHMTKFNSSFSLEGLLLRLLTRFVITVCFLLSSYSAAPVLAQNANNVDLNLVLAIDCSFSVDTSEFRLQMQGLGKAFRKAEIYDAIRRGTNGRIAVSVFQWSDERTQVIVVPWMIVDSEEAMTLLADQLETMPRKVPEGGTAISSAMSFATAMLEASPFNADRRIIDISSDGRNNIGISPDRIRNEIVKRGITINALVIINEWPTLDKYFENQVVGGPGNFVIIANDYVAYAEGIYRKLLKEITGPGVS